MTLSDDIDAYLSYRRAAYAGNTVASSRTTLKQFLAHVGNVQTKNLEPRHAERFQSTLLSRGMKPGSVNHRMSQLSTFAKWAVTHRKMPTNFTTTTRKMPVPKKPRLRIPVTEFDRVLDQATRPDERITVALGLFLFLRGGEIRTLKVSDVDLDQQTIAVTVHKTNDWDEMPVVWELDQELRRWFVAYQHDIGRPLRGSDYLVPAHKKYPGWMEASERETGNFDPEKMVLRPFRHVQRVLERAGYPAPSGAGEGVHTLRRSGARALFDGLVEGRFDEHSPAAKDDALRQVMTMLHHKSIETTQGYIGLEPDRLKRDRTLKGIHFLPPKGGNVTELRRAE